jgi:hypothetical protein
MDKTSNLPQSPSLKQTAVGSSISWVKKEDFTPIEGQFYWVIIPNPESDTGFYVPYSAQYKDGYYVTDQENEAVEIDNAGISHVSLIVYPS